MRLAALSAGSQAPRGHFGGTVHSVFREACNIRLDDGGLLGLLGMHLGNVPHGVRLEVAADFDFRGHLTVGRTIGCRADVLRVAGSALAIDLGTAQPWAASLPPAGIDLERPAVDQAWRTAWDTLRRGRANAGDMKPNAPARRVDAQGVRLARAVRRLQNGEAARALDRLIGCGPGLTPSGDDLIVGFVAGVWSTAGDHPARRAFLQTFCRAVDAAAAATGDISRAYLTHASHGRFAERLTTLARQIGEGVRGDAVERATTAALRVGHSSGAAGVFGLLLGLSVWQAHAAPLVDLGTLAHG